MRKSIKRIVSTVLAASMVLTSCVVSNLSIATAGEQVVPVEFTEKEFKHPLDAAYEGLVTVEMTINAEDILGDGSLLRLRSEATSQDFDAALRIMNSSTGEVILGKSEGVVAGTMVIGENTVVLTFNTITGDITCNLNGTVTSRKNSNSEQLGLNVSSIKMGGKKLKGAITRLNVTAESVEAPTTEATTVAPTTEATTEATTVAPTTEATTVAPTTEATTEEITVAADEIRITPEYVVNGDQLTVNYKATVGANTSFNNYTMFASFDPTVLKPVSATDGDIVYTTKDATGNPINVPASNATNITSQFDNVPSAGNTDYPSADGTKTQAELGKIKVAYCIFDKDFSGASTTLPAFKDSGVLFSITYDIIGDANGTVLDTKIGVMNAVSADNNIASTPSVVSPDSATISGIPVVTTESTTETTTTEVTTEATTEGVTGLALVGDTVNGNSGTATVTFKLANNTSGVANYTIFVKYDPTKIMATGGSTPGFTYDSNVVANQINYVPAEKDPDYSDVSADGVKTAAQLGKLKIAGINQTNVSGDVDALKIDFTVADTSVAGNYPVEITVVSMGDENGNLYGSFESLNGAVVVTTSSETTTEGTTSTVETTEATTSATEATTSATEATTSATEATTSESTETTTRRQGGGGGGSNGKPVVVTTTEAATETVTEDAVEVTTQNSVIAGDKPGEIIVVTPNGQVVVSVPTEKDPNYTGFDDLSNYPWATSSINKLAELGIISGVADKTFGPALPCRRADFAILINRTLGVSVASTPKNFYDNEDQSKYYYNDVMVGYNAGILSGYGDNNYKPEQYCTREEMAVLVAKSYEWLGNDVTSTSLSVNDKYTDVDDIAFWSAPYVAYLTDMGVLNGNTDGTLLPKNFINRAEMAVMMSVVYDYALNLVEEVHAAATEETTEVTTADESATETTTVEETSTETTTVEEDL